LYGISESTIGRIIADLKEKNQIRNYQARTTLNGKTGKQYVRNTTKKEKKLRIGHYKPDKPGDLVQIDAISIFLNNTKRYIITALDVKTRFAFAYSYKSLSSNTARDFMTKLIEVAPFPITHIQTDNGKEFHKYFREYVKSQKIIHFYNYPKSPKMNTFVERFNRTIQDQHVSWHMAELYEPTEFNQSLMQYLIWYNTEKPHRGIGKVPPLCYFVNSLVNINQSNMLWTSTDC
jgi:transposase InsO family protein